MESAKRTVSVEHLRAALDRFGLLQTISALQAKLCGPVVLFGSQARADIGRYVSRQRGESGGLLIGVAAERVAGPHLVLCISEVVLSESHQSNSVFLTMDPTIWVPAQLRRAEGLMVLGWFHSHPARGAYFSGTDQTTQRRFFSRPYSLGYVIDPVYDDHAYFLGPESVELPWQSVLTIPDAAAIVASLRR